MGGLVVLLAGWFGYQVLTGLPDKDQMRELAETAEGTTVFDAPDRPIFSIPTQYRVEVELARMSPNLRQAVIAVEDARFYDHDGIDGIRVVGAVVNDIRQGRAAEGASTITQQLARVSFLTRDKTLRRKVREAILAQRIEKLYSKDEILEIYLNKVYFGDGLYGAEAAARGYFGKPASDLTVAQAAMLAGIIKAPSAANPAANLERAIERRKVVLKLMRERKFIDQAQYDAARTETVVLYDNLRREDSTGLHFKEIVRRQLIERFAKNAIHQGRLRVYTTIDADMQKAAGTSLESRRVPRTSSRSTMLEDIESRIGGSTNNEPLQAALIAIDPGTGEVRAIVGGRDTSSVGLNRALQSKRQPGSTFKPFVYAAAIENGLSPASVIDRLDQPVPTYKGAWLPEEEHSAASSMTMRTALRTSSNRAAVRVLEAVGIDRAVHMQKPSASAHVPSLALGSGEVTLASMTAAYGAFAREGMVREPIFIKRVEDQDGVVLYRNDSRPRRAISETTAFLMSTMLADVIDAGTGYRFRPMGLKKPAAGKTGTTNDFFDAWFVGFTPKLVAGVWVGFDRPRTIVKNGFGGDLAVPMWTHFMLAATANDDAASFEPPRDVVPLEVCAVSGERPGAGCRHAASITRTGTVTYQSMVYTDDFVRGTEPERTCAVHAAQYQPYPEPYFALSVFEGVDLALTARPAPPDPVPAAIPAAPRVEQNPASALPPPAPPETLPGPDYH